MPLTRMGRVEMRSTFEMGGPPRLLSSWRGSAGLPPTEPRLRVLRSILPRILGSMPAYSRTKMGTRAPTMVSAERASAPNRESVMMAAHFLHSGRLRGSFGSGVGIGMHCSCPSLKSCVDPTTCASAPLPLSTKTSSIESRILLCFDMLLKGMCVLF
jgi:hypothetical protein